MRVGVKSLVQPPADARRAVPEALPVTDVWILVRLALKRDRVMIPAWVLGLGARRRRSPPPPTRTSTRPSPRAARSSGRSARTPATLALYGRIYADSVGGLVAWRLGGIALALGGLMAILLVMRHTRAEEETGRAELVGAGVVGRHAPLAAALDHRGAGERRARRDRHARRRRHRPRLRRRAGARCLASRCVGPRVRGRGRGGGAGRGVRARRQRARGRGARRRVRAARDRRRRPAPGLLVLPARLGAGDPPLRRRALVADRRAARARPR